MKVLAGSPPLRGLVVGLGVLPGLLAISIGCINRGSVTVGGACTIDESCRTGVCLRESSASEGRAWIGGYCSGNCSSHGCPQGKCLELSEGESFCLSECGSSEDCRHGYVCSPDAKVCLPDCRLGWSCGSALTCDSSSGACTTPKQAIGAACTLNAGCQGSLCIPESSSSSGTSWTAGTCTQDCASSSCPSGSTCLKLQDGNSRCLANCSNSTACRKGYVCSPDARICLPDCRLGWSCGSSLDCDSTTGACNAPAPTPQSIGAACTLNAGCQGGLCIPESSSSNGTSWTDGTCTQDCASSSCPSGSTCFKLQDDNSRCLTACFASTSCRQGYVCSSDARVCLPDCRLGWSCGATLVCGPSTGECQTADVPDAGIRMDARPTSWDSSRDAAPTRAPDAFTPGAGGIGGTGGRGSTGAGGTGGPGGRT